MLVFGHVGLTIGLARVLSREVDVRWVAVAAMLPDIIDKPLRYFIASFHTEQHADRGTFTHRATCRYGGGAPPTAHHPRAGGCRPDAAHAFAPGWHVDPRSARQSTLALGRQWVPPLYEEGMSEGTT